MRADRKVSYGEIMETDEPLADRRLFEDRTGRPGSGP